MVSCFAVFGDEHTVEINCLCRDFVTVIRLSLTVVAVVCSSKLIPHIHIGAKCL